MVQEVRGSDILTMLANIIESQPHGIQNSQSNNNNSNPVSSIAVASALNSNSMNSPHESSQIAVSSTQPSISSGNGQMMEMNNQVPTASSSNNTDAEIAEIERISSTFISQNFPAASSATNTVPGGALLYDGSNNVGMSDEVGGVLDSRMAYPSNIDFNIPQNQVALMEALNSMDKDSFPEAVSQSSVQNSQSQAGLRTGTTSNQSVSYAAQSFVSLLQQQSSQIDSCSNLWQMTPMQNSTGAGHFSGNGSGKARIDGNNNTQHMSSTASDGGNMVIPSANRLETVSTQGISSNHHMYKANKHQQQSTRAVSNGTQQYVPNNSMQYAQGKHVSKMNNDLFMSLGKEGINSELVREGKEKRLTTTPIPSDADKSSGSCSSSSSGSVSGPEQSPDHVIERTGNSRRTLTQQEMNGHFTESSTRNSHNAAMHQAAGNMKGYPPYNSTSMMNFGTINFSSVMDNGQGVPSELNYDNRKTHSGNVDMNSQPLPTSDSVVEIDETVTSPLENIPVSPCTPTTEQGDVLSPMHLNNPTESQHNIRHNSVVPFARLQTNANTMQMANSNVNNTMGVHAQYVNNPNVKKTSSKKSDSTKKSSSHKQHKIRDSNNNHLVNSYRDRTSSPSNCKMKDKQKQPKSSKQHGQKNDFGINDRSKTQGEYQGSLHFQNNAISTPNQNGLHSTALIPKVNADPMKKQLYPNTNPNSTNILDNLANSSSVYRNNLPMSRGLHQAHGAVQMNPHAFPSQHPVRHPSVNHTANPTTPVVSNSSNPASGSATRQWQTVTAVQVPKLPPILSEQDRIPKRGRPSKKMMQQNLKIKKDNAQQQSNTPVAPVVQPKASQQPAPETSPVPNKLLSTYTINDKGMVEEIAPKLKENRRSKERTQAFLKMLDEIKTTSKQQMALNPKFGEKGKAAGEKPKRRSKPRTKVFGRGVSQPLTESGITETMFTFSALAHQYKISNSILSRATENLLKSAASKRSKEQSLGNAPGNQALRSSSSNSSKKGVSVPHCEVKNSTSSRATVPNPQVLPVAPPKISQGVPISRSNTQQSISHPPILHTPPNSVAPTVQEISQRRLVPTVPPVNKVQPISVNSRQVVPHAPTPVALPETITEPPPSSDGLLTGVKSKHKKKKHKKHKKHKYTEGKLTGKKKKKDKEHKKKSKKKSKTKIGPSTSVSVVKPPYQAVAEESNQEVTVAVTHTFTETTSGNLQNASFDSGFRQSSNNDDVSNWGVDDNAYDGEDSSSDETNSVPVPRLDSAPDKATASSNSENLTSFAQYSNSKLDFGMFSNQKQSGSDDTTSVKATKVTEQTNQGNSFSNATTLRPKKHHKHKKKRFFRKSKNSCDPALLVLLGNIVENMKNLKITSSQAMSRSLSPRSHTNIFFATSLSDSPQISLWSDANANSLSTNKSDPQTSILKNTAFKSSQPKKSQGKTGQFPSNSARTSTSTTSRVSSFTNTNTMSVFCSSPFFQKYGYVSKVTQVLSSSVTTVSASGRLTAPRSSLASQVHPAPCVSTDVLSKSPNTTERVQESLVVVPSPIVSQGGTRGAKFEKRKRGWPRGKLRGPRAKKGRMVNSDGDSSVSENIQRNTNVANQPDGVNRKTQSSPADVDLSEDKNPSTSKPNGVPVRTPGTSIKAAQQVSGNKAKEDRSTSPKSTTNEKEMGNIVNEALLHQIRQAIEANLPAHPSVNKDAITKSVDAALQSFIENMNKGQATPQEGPSASRVAVEDGSAKKKLGKKGPRRKSSLDHGSSCLETTGNSVRSNAEKHPKKVWAYKHQDTETSNVLDPNKKEPLAVVSNISKKRGPGRPRKNPVLNQMVTSKKGGSLELGKVPTASATVVPHKRIPRGMTSRAILNCAKVGVKRPIAGSRHHKPESKPSFGKEKNNGMISKRKAMVSVDAFCSVKSLQSRIRSGSFKDGPEPSIYDGTPIGDHIRATINLTVDMYRWDNYKKFEEACSSIEREMQGEESECSLSENKRKLSGPKKSIESVIEKLKSKQAQTVHSVAAAALLQLHDFNSRSSDEQMKNSTPDTHSGSAAVPMKRPRGRPKKHAQQDDIFDPVSKRPKMVSSEKDSTSQDDMKDLTQFSTRQQHEVNPLSSTDKPILRAGLYSSTYKLENNSEESSDEVETVHLPPPFDAGLYLRRLQRDFQLPYDVWWMYKHLKISATQNPSTQYVSIMNNVYVSPKPVLNLGDHICTCKPTESGGQGCGRQCLNRLMYIECTPSSCPCGDRCSNQVIQKGDWCKTLERIKTADRGWGMSTTQQIPEGSFILEYVGEVLSEAEFRTRTIEQYHAYNDHYCVQLDNSTVIDGYRMANEGRYVNHSCEPNCEMLKWCVDGEYRICLFAKRDIKPDEELTYDYNFHSYNMNQQQKCKCGSQNCRGYIGGKAQRSPSRELEIPTVPAGNVPVSRLNKATSKQGTGGKHKTNPEEKKKSSSKEEEMGVKEFSILQMKPLSSREREFIRIRQLFLIRSLAQVRRKEEEQQRALAKRSSQGGSSGAKSSSKSKSKKHLQNKEEKERLYNAVTEMYTAIATCKDQNGVSVAIPFMNLPSKKKNPDYYERISDPIDLSVIEHNIVTYHYKDIETFHADVQRVFKNAEKYHGRKSTLGKDVTRLRKAYANARGAVMLLWNGHKKHPEKTCEVADKDLNENNENIHRKNADYIRCICRIYKDEGLMVQCEKCYVWQHCDCMGVKPGSTDRYLCEECDPRPVSKEVKVIPPPPNSPPGHTYYVTILRDNLLIKQGDCAYLMRDHRLRHNSNAPSMRANRNLANIPQESLDIFRIEKLWTDERGDKYAYGHHFLRPHETHHAPSRTFYPNELFASPFYEIIPVEAIVGLCMVMDLYTYCKGKPKDFKMSDIFICDFRVDKAASLFTRITKKRYPICTKPHVFDSYKTKLCPKRNFQPHQLPEHYKKPAGRPSHNSDSEMVEISGELVTVSGGVDIDAENALGFAEGGESNSTGEGSNTSGRWKKRQRLNGIAHKLLSKLPKQASNIQ